MKNMILNKKKVFYITVFGILILLFCTVGIKLYLDTRNSTEEPTEVKKSLDALELYGYTLDDKDTTLYKEYFEELKGILNEEKVNKEEYAKTLVKLFVTDFYSLTNKITSTDIGSLEFIHVDLIENFKINAGDTIYNSIESNLYGNREQSLPEVSVVEIESVDTISYTYKEKEFVGYSVKANWSYVTDMGYDKTATFILIDDNNKLNVVEEKVE